MKKIIITIITILAFAGCVRTKVVNDENGLTVSRIAVLYPFEIEGFSYNPTNGAFNVGTYRTDGGTDSIEKVAKGVAEGVVEGMK